MMSQILKFVSSFVYDSTIVDSLLSPCSYELEPLDWVGIHCPSESALTLTLFRTLFLILFGFLSLKESTCKIRENILYFTSKALFVLEEIKV